MALTPLTIHKILILRLTIVWQEPEPAPVGVIFAPGNLHRPRAFENGENVVPH